MQVTAKADDELGMEVSFAEELMWQADFGGPGAVPFFDCARSLWLALRLQGTLDQEALRSSIDAVIRRHDVLRSRFIARNGHPVRLMSQRSSFSFTTIKRLNPAREDPYEILADEIKPALEGQFDFARGPLICAALVALSSHDHILAIAAHHIIFDRWSKRLLESELRRFYCDYVTGAAKGIRPLSVQYQDYVRWQREQLHSKHGHDLCEYWTNQLRGLPHLILPCDGPHGPVRSTRSGTSLFTVPAEDVNRLVVLSRQSRTTLAATMLAIFTLFLYRLSGADDVAVGVPISDRRRPEFEEIIGLFMNVVIVRVAISIGMTFLGLLDRVRRGLVDACIRQDLPYGYLRRISATQPPYRVVFNFLPNLSSTELELAGLQTRALSISMEQQSLADLSFHVRLEAGTMLCRLVYKADLFSENSARKFTSQIQTLTKAVLQTPESCIDMHDME